MTTQSNPVQSYSRRNFMKGLGTAAAAGGLVGVSPHSREKAAVRAEPFAGLTETPDETIARVVADPTDIPDPISRHGPTHHEILLEAVEVESEIEPGVVFKFMTFNGQIPGPMLRVRQGDTIQFTMKNSPDNYMPHNVDFHAVYGPGGGAVATTAAPGSAASMSFKAMYPGAFCYHCAIPNLDYHISSGMFGLIVVEPPEGLARVDREFYLGQHEVYTNKPTGEKGQHAFDFEAMKVKMVDHALSRVARKGMMGAIDVKGAPRASIFDADWAPTNS